MKKGWLVINSFMNSDKFLNIYKMLNDSFLDHNAVLEIKKASDIGINVDLSLSEKPDFVIFWDKDIYLAQKLENLGCVLFNSARAIELCDNKILMYQELQKYNIKIPKTFIAPKTFEGLGYSDLSFFKKVVDEIGFPLVIKEAYGSFGQQVYLVNSMDEARKIIGMIGYKDFLIQEYIKESKGRDVRINIVGGKAIISMLRLNEDDFRSNISNGGAGSFYEPSSEFIKIAEKAANCFGLDFAGVDVMFGPNNEPIICELNSNPQFKSTLDATGYDLSKYIASYILGKIGG